MANHTAPALLLRVGDQEKLQKLVRSTTAAAGLAARARVVLLAAEGLANYEIAASAGMSRPTVNRWRARYAERGIDGLADEPRPGRPKTIDEAKIIAATLSPPPKSLGVRHWSSRLLAPRLGVDHSTVAGVWRRYGVKPWEPETFKFSTDPELVAKVTDVQRPESGAGENPVVLCVDESPESRH